MLLRNLDAAVSQQNGYLIDGNASQQQFDGKSIAEHVGMTSLRSVVGVLDLGQFKQFPETPLVALDHTLFIPVAAPEEISGIV